MQFHRYIQGFNHGYILAKYEPQMTKSILKSIGPNTEYQEGFISGKEEYDLELTRIQAQELKNLRNKSQDRDKGLERD